MSVASAVLGEYMRDVQTLREQGWDGVATIRKTSPLDRNIRDWFGNTAQQRYELDLYKLVKAERERKTEAPKPARARPWSKARLVREQRMRDALLSVVKANGWTGRGVRELARRAGMPHRTARDVLARMEANGEILVQPWQVGQGRGRHGIKVLREHPAWSDLNYAHPLALSEPTAQVRGKLRTPLSTRQGRP